MELSLINLPNLGIADVKLDKGIIDNLWLLIDKAKKENKNKRSDLAGNITSSLEMENATFLIPVLKEVTQQYEKKYGAGFHSLGSNVKDHIISLDSLWVNFQFKNEFNPIHNHNGAYSFVIWMKIPTEFSEQKELPFVKGSNDPNLVSNFVFTFTNIIGDIEQLTIPMGKEFEGRLVLFPSRLKHLVYPFYGTDESRISISGNLSFSKK